jgi:hypothetical protein
MLSEVEELKCLYKQNKICDSTEVRCEKCPCRVCSAYSCRNIKKTCGLSEMVSDIFFGGGNDKQNSGEREKPKGVQRLSEWVKDVSLS